MKAAIQANLFQRVWASSIDVCFMAAVMLALLHLFPELYIKYWADRFLFCILFLFKDISGELSPLKWLMGLAVILKPKTEK